MSMPQPQFQPRPQFQPQSQPQLQSQQWMPPPPPTVVVPGASAHPPQTATAPGRELLARAKVEDGPPPTPAPAWRAPAKVDLPAPEQLGVRPPPAADADSVDWNATHARLRGLGALGWQLGRLPQGGYRFSFLLPTAEPNRSRHYEGTGSTEAEAVRLALAGVAPTPPRP
jgi:hypothetical protein